MTHKSYSLTAGLIFSLIALGHLVRLVLDVSWVVAGRVIPMWASVVGLLIGAFMGYEGFRLSRKE